MCQICLLMYIQSRYLHTSAVPEVLSLFLLYTFVHLYSHQRDGLFSVCQCLTKPSLYYTIYTYKNAIVSLPSRLILTIECMDASSTASLQVLARIKGSGVSNDRWTIISVSFSCSSGGESILFSRLARGSHTFM